MFLDGSCVYTFDAAGEAGWLLLKWATGELSHIPLASQVGLFGSSSKIYSGTFTAERKHKIHEVILRTFAAHLATTYAENDDHYKSNNATKHDSSYSSATPEKHIKYTHACVHYNLITGILYR